MPRRYRLKPWHGDRWEAFVHNAIERRVFSHLDAIASPLGIDDPTEQKALGDAVTVEMRRAWSYLRDVQSAPSEQMATHVLEELLKIEEIAIAVEHCDPTTRYLLERYDWPSRGKIFIEQISDDPQRLSKAAQRALNAARDAKVRHRPPGTKNFAEHVFADGLARVFHRFGGRVGRRVNPYSGHEYGPYRAFVASVIALVPKRIARWSVSKRAGRDPVDYIVRLSTRHRRFIP
jgi:hypothetical protein